MDKQYESSVHLRHPSTDPEEDDVPVHGAAHPAPAADYADREADHQLPGLHQGRYVSVTAGGTLP